MHGAVEERSSLEETQRLSCHRPRVVAETASSLPFADVEPTRATLPLVGSFNWTARQPSSPRSRFLRSTGGSRERARDLRSTLDYTRGCTLELE